MKKLGSAFALAVLAAVLALGQDAVSATGAAATPGVAAEGGHYLVRSALGAERATLLLGRLEGLFGLFNRVFRFDADRLPGKLSVREFATKADFDAYLLQAAGETRGDFVYLHYPSPPKRELLLFAKADPDWSSSLAHQAFIQYLKAFVQEPPLWMRDGFATWFENVRWEGNQGNPTLLENLAWLDSAKSLRAKGGLIGLDRLLNATPEEARSAVEVFYPEAWAFVSFLINDPAGEGGRLLWEGIATLGPDASLADNQAGFARRLADWYGTEATEKAFHAYLDSRRTLPQLVAAGVDLYGKKEFAAASAAFVEAARLEPSSYLPPYYLGLIAYARAEYQVAEALYRQAIIRGCDLATATYAIGLSQVAAGLYDEAALTLAQAALANPERYKAKVDEILKKLGKQ